MFQKIKNKYKPIFILVRKLLNFLKKQYVFIYFINTEFFNESISIIIFYRFNILILKLPIIEYV